MINTESEYRIKRDEILSKFTSEFLITHRHNATFRAIYEMLIRDADPYEMIEKLLDLNVENSKTIKAIVENIRHPHSIILTNNEKNAQESDATMTP